MSYETILKALNDDKFKKELIENMQMTEESFNKAVDEMINDSDILDDINVDMGVV